MSLKMDGNLTTRFLPLFSFFYIFCSTYYVNLGYLLRLFLSSLLKIQHTQFSKKNKRYIKASIIFFRAVLIVEHPPRYNDIKHSTNIMNDYTNNGCQNEDHKYALDIAVIIKNLLDRRTKEINRITAFQYWFVDMHKYHIFFFFVKSACDMASANKGNIGEYKIAKSQYCSKPMV